MGSLAEARSFERFFPSEASSCAPSPTIGAAAALWTTTLHAVVRRRTDGAGAWLSVNQWEPVPNTMRRTKMPQGAA